MPEPICPHTPGLPPRSCGECLYEGNYTLKPAIAAPRGRAPRGPKTKSSGRPFRAQYEGECAYCSAGIDKGELIFETPEGGYAHYRHVAGGKGR